MSLVVDLKARVFGEDDKAYRIFPGVRYRHYDIMSKLGVVFLDYPGLPLSSGGHYGRTDEVKEAIVRGERYADVAYRKSDRVAEMMADVASQDLSNTRWSRRREQALSWINGLYHEIAAGDLVVLPGPIGYRDDEARPTLVGEVISGTERWKEGPGAYANAGLLVRRVRWLAEIDERDLDHRTYRSLRTQNALISMRAELLRPVLGAAYQNVIVNGDFLARFQTTGAEFNARESYHFQAFVLAVVEAYSRRSEADVTRQLDDSIYAMAAAVKRGERDIPEQDFSIHSPGYTTLKGSAIVFVVSALFALALEAQAEPIDSNGAVQVRLENSDSARYDPCEVDGIDDATRETLRAMGYNRWQEACRAAQAANEDEGFSPRATVKR